MRYEEEEEEDSEAEASESEGSASDENPQQTHTGYIARHSLFTASQFPMVFVNSTLYRVYDPRDYEHLSVSGEVKELFRHITRYTPQTIELETQLRPFVPEYIPAIGDIDAFLKVNVPTTVHTHYP